MTGWCLFRFDLFVALINVVRLAGSLGQESSRETRSWSSTEHWSETWTWCTSSQCCRKSFLFRWWSAAVEPIRLTWLAYWEQLTTSSTVSSVHRHLPISSSLTTFYLISSCRLLLGVSRTTTYKYYKAVERRQTRPAENQANDCERFTGSLPCHTNALSLCLDVCRPQSISLFLHASMSGYEMWLLMTN